MTMLDTDIDTTFETIVHDIVICGADGCEHVAVWCSTCSSCGETLPACQEHRDEMDAYFEHMTRLHPGGHIRCKTCGNPMPNPVLWRPI